MTFECWQCGAVLTDLILPVSRRETCRACEAEIHTCRMCRHFAPNRLDQCLEERAEDVSNRELANFCDWFDPVPDAFSRTQGTGDDAAKAALAALFGDAPTEAPKSADANLEALNDLFSKPDDSKD